MLRRIFRTSEEDYKDKLAEMRQTYEGGEIMDPVPMAPPIGFRAEPSMVDYIRGLIQSEKLKQEAEAAGAESFEESDDFDIEDEEEPISAYEFERIFEPHPPTSTVPVGKPLESAETLPTDPVTEPPAAPKK